MVMSGVMFQYSICDIHFGIMKVDLISVDNQLHLIDKSFFFNWAKGEVRLLPIKRTI